MRDDTTALARVVRTCAPDLVLVRRPRFRWRKKLAGSRPRRPRSCPAARPPRAPRSSARCGPPSNAPRNILLPFTPGLHRRGLAAAVVRFGAARLGVVSCHLSLQKDERYTQSGLLLDRLAALGTPHALAGSRF